MSQPDLPVSETAPADPFVAVNGRLRQLAERGELRQYGPGARVITEGDRGQSLFIVLCGRLRVFSMSGHGREITFGVPGPGEFLGEISLDGGPRSASVEALEGATLAVIARDVLDAFVHEHPDFAFELLAQLSRRTRAADLSARSVAMNDVYGRLKNLLEAAAPPAADGVRRVAERFTHQALAQRLGCSKEMVSRLMKDLEHAGYVRVDEGHWVLAGALPARW